jgi:hypothetical protein
MLPTLPDHVIVRVDAFRAGTVNDSHLAPSYSRISELAARTLRGCPDMNDGKMLAAP